MPLEKTGSETFIWWLKAFQEGHLKTSSFMANLLWDVPFCGCWYIEP